MSIGIYSTDIGDSPKESLQFKVNTTSISCLHIFPVLSLGKKESHLPIFCILNITSESYEKDFRNWIIKSFFYLIDGIAKRGRDDFKVITKQFEIVHWLVNSTSKYIFILKFNLQIKIIATLLCVFLTWYNYSLFNDGARQPPKRNDWSLICHLFPLLDQP